MRLEALLGASMNLECFQAPQCSSKHFDALGPHSHRLALTPLTRSLHTISEIPLAALDDLGFITPHGGLIFSFRYGRVTNISRSWTKAPRSGSKFQRSTLSHELPPMAFIKDSDALGVSDESAPPEPIPMDINTTPTRVKYQEWRKKNA